MADAKDQDSSEESEIDTARQIQQLKAQAAKAAQKAGEDHLSIPTNLEPSSSQGALSGGSTGGKSTEDLKHSNDLPEDKEIQSSSEDEM